MDESLKTSEAQLIEQRCQPEANVDELDRRIWELFGEDWAVLSTDLSGFSRRVAEFGIIHFRSALPSIAPSPCSAPAHSSISGARQPNRFKSASASAAAGSCASAITTSGDAR
jgi:hypothetical protein